MLNKSTIGFILIYGIIIIILGYVGYMQSGSQASLWAGLILGGLLVLSGIGMLAGQKVGAYVALGSTFLLTAVFAYRYAVTGKGMPAILAVLSAGMLLFLLARFGKWKA
jgi:uncharacterized membrane protein (UPF0136 family)